MGHYEQDYADDEKRKAQTRAHDLLMKAQRESGKANDRQVGGNHYKNGGEEHWDRAWRLQYDPFQYIITKWVERWRDKGGIEDLRKAQHALEKYIEVVEKDQLTIAQKGIGIPEGPQPSRHPYEKIAEQTEGVERHIR